MRKIIISVAPSPGPAPIDPDLLAEDLASCIKEGASVCHLHCKNKAGKLTEDISFFSSCFDKIRSRGDIIVQASTGGISDMNIKQRCNPLEYPFVETASLNGGTTNLGEYVYINSFDDIRYCAHKCFAKKIVSEIEVFDIGMINNIQLMRQEQPFREPILFNLVFGHKGGLPPTIEALTAFRSFLPPDSLWGVTHFGRDNWTFLAAAIAMGASLVRIGFEDSHWLEGDVNADYNHQLVARLASLIKVMGLEVATPDQAREIINSKNR